MKELEFEELFNLIAKDEIEEVIGKLSLVKSDGFKKELTMISSKFYRVKKDERKGIVSRDEVAIERNRVNNNLIDLINDFKSLFGDKKELNIPIKATSINNQNFKEAKVIYENQFETVMQQIENAKTLIWIAMPFFTDKRILKKLKEKAKENVLIEIITSVNEFNPIEDFKNNPENIEFRTLPVEKGMLYLKLCIIDLDVVITGSYNWTYYNAHISKETVIIHKDKIIVHEFAKKYNLIRTNTINLLKT